MKLKIGEEKLKDSAIRLKKQRELTIGVGGLCLVQ